MTTHSERLVAPAWWHGAAFSFFGFGLAAGALCVAAGPVVGIRLLGVVALASAALGLALVAYTWRCEEPAAWDAVTRRARGSLSAFAMGWRRLWVRRLTLDRYWQNLVWAGMK